MKNLKQNKLFRYALGRSLIVLFILLASCTSAPAESIAPEEPTVAQVLATETLSLLPTPTPYPFGSPIPFPTQQQNLPLPTATPTLTPLPAVLPKFPLDGYVMLFAKDGDLYFQDEENAPVKLAHIVKSFRAPSYVRGLKTVSPYYTFLGYAYEDFGIQVSPFKISDDNQKVIFSEGDGNIYSINSDGTQKQTIISSNWLASLETGISVEELDFVPQTHIVYVKARLCEKEEQPYLCSTSIFLIDANTGKMEKLDYLGKLVEHEHFGIKNNIRFSPDGKMLAVGTKEGVTIYILDGEVTRQNILPFVSEFEIFPSLFWLPDSSGFVVALPDALADVAMWDHTTAFTIWRYSLNDNSAVQISFDPPVIQYYFEVSPDGNWMVYYGGIYESPYYLYLGNLTDGNTMRLGTAGEQGDMLWSPDSKHFLATIGLGALDGSFLHPMPPSFSWVDARHFSATRFSLVNGEEHGQHLVGEIRDDGIVYYETGFFYPLYNLLLMKPKQ